MRFPRSIQGPLTLPVAVLMLAGATTSVAAQGHELFTWTGTVDREIQITMRGRTAWATGPTQFGEERGRMQIQGMVPRAEGRVDLRVEDGRGDVDVIQQPSVRNDYTAIVRVRDRSGGADRYRLRAWWSPVGRLGGFPGSASGRIGDYDRDEWYDRDPRWDRDPWYNRPGRGRGSDRFELLWSGYVDDVLEIRLRGDRIEYRTLSGKTVREVRVEMPRRGGFRPMSTVEIGWHAGRGNVRVMQQPTPRNGFTTIIHVRDPQRGYGRFAFELVSDRVAYGRRP